MYWNANGKRVKGNQVMPRKVSTEETLGIREASKYLDSLGVDVSEMRVRSLVRQHEIFTKPTVPGDDSTKGAVKSKSPNSDIELWHINKSALDRYAAAYLRGDVRANGGGGPGGAKFYRISLTSDQLATLREFCQANGISEPVRPKYYNNSKKAKAARAKAAGSSEENGSSDEDYDGGEDEDTLEDLLEDEQVAA
jgi:hypothetical protein